MLKFLMFINLGQCTLIRNILHGSHFKKIWIIQKQENQLKTLELHLGVDFADGIG